MGVGAVALGGFVVLLCVGLMSMSMRMDESQARGASMPDMMPMKRSMQALQSENAKLRQQLNATFVENTLLRTKLRLSLPRGHILEADLAKPKLTMAVPSPSAAPTIVAGASSADSGRRPRGLNARLRQSTEFNKERATMVATNKQIILTFVNKIRLDFATTWVMHVRRLGLTNWLIGATDRASLKEMSRAGYPCFDMSTNLPEGEWPWGSPSFKSLGPHKIELIYKAILWDLEVIITDIDALVLRYRLRRLHSPTRAILPHYTTHAHARKLTPFSCMPPLSHAHTLSLTLSHPLS